jgi:hypothetical protein
MMNLYYVLFVASAGFVLQMYLPWYAALIPPLIAGLAFQLPAARQLLLGFLTTAMVWALYATVKNQLNQGILASKITGLMPFEQPFLLIGIAALIAGISGLLGAWSGIRLKTVLQSK